MRDFRCPSCTITGTVCAPLSINISNYRCDICVFGILDDSVRPSAQYTNVLNNITVQSDFSNTITTSSVATATGIITNTGTNGLVQGKAVHFSVGGTLPAAFSTATTYYVLPNNLTPTTFQLSATEGGSAIVPVTSSMTATAIAGTAGSRAIVTNGTYAVYQLTNMMTVFSDWQGISIFGTGSDIAVTNWNVVGWDYANNSYSAFYCGTAGEYCTVTGRWLTQSVNSTATTAGPGTFQTSHAN